MFKTEDTEIKQVMLVSNKVKKLIKLLNDEITEKDNKVKVPKVIIFVKDRVVAEYLKNILCK